MYFSVHAVTGAVFGTITANPGTAFVAGLGSHILLDMIPHHDYSKVSSGLIDLIFGIIVISFFMGVGHDLNLLIGAIGGGIPDLEVAIGYLRGKHWNIFPSHTGLTPHNRLQNVTGVVIQLVIFFAGIGFLFIMNK